MPKTWIRAEKQFTRRIGVNTVVGHPKHPDPRGRVAEVEEGEALNNLISGGYAKRISQSEYRKELEAGTVTAGENLVAQTRGEAPKASVTMTDGQLDRMANERGVKFTGKETRAQRVKKINEKKVDVSADLPENDRWAASAGDTRDSTLHPQRSGTQSDVTEAGTTDRNGFSTSGVQTAGEDLEDEADAAPAGGTSKTKADDKKDDAGSGGGSSSGS